MNKIFSVNFAAGSGARRVGLKEDGSHIIEPLFHRFNLAQMRLNKQLEKLSWFDVIKSYTKKDLQEDKEFWDKHSLFLENNPRGYGYYMWKPYIIKKTFDQMNEGDILVYLDVGCDLHIPSKDLKDLKSSFINLVKEKEIVYSKNSLDQHLGFGKIDAYDFYGITSEDLIKTGAYAEANRLFFIKNNINEKIINEWWDSMNGNYHLWDDSVTGKIHPQKEKYGESRWDQMMLQIVLYKNNALDRQNTYQQIVTESEEKKQILSIFLHTRNRGGKSQFCSYRTPDGDCECKCCAV